MGNPRFRMEKAWLRREWQGYTGDGQRRACKLLILVLVVVLCGRFKEGGSLCYLRK